MRPDRNTARERWNVNQVAHLLLNTHAADVASAYARQRVVSSTNAGDRAGATAWQNVLGAIAAIQHQRVWNGSWVG